MVFTLIGPVVDDQGERWHTRCRVVSVGHGAYNGGED